MDFKELRVSNNFFSIISILIQKESKELNEQLETKVHKLQVFK